MGKGSHDPQADEPAKLAARTLTMKRSASRDLLGDALDCAASCIDAAALDAYRLDYASSAFGVRYPDTSFPFVLAAAAAIDASSACRRARSSHGGAKSLQKHTYTGHAPAASSAAQLCRQRPPKKTLPKVHTPVPPTPSPSRPRTAKKRKKNAGIDWERCAARGANSRRPTTTRPP